MNLLHAESVLECGGKRSATPLSNCLRSSLHTKAPSLLTAGKDKLNLFLSECD